METRMACLRVGGMLVILLLSLSPLVRADYLETIPVFWAPRRFEWNSSGNLCQITRKIRNEEPEWTATRYCFLGWV